MARATGPAGTGIGDSGWSVRVATGVTVLSEKLATYSVLPSGVRAIALGERPTGIGAPLTKVVVSMGTTADGNVCLMAWAWG